MGVKTSRRIAAVIVALVMIMTSAVATFAATKYDTASSAQGTSQANKSTGNMTDKTITVDDYTGQVSAKTSKGKVLKVDGNEISGLKVGDLVTITTDNGDSYRWFKTAKVKKATKKKVTWKKVKGASFYVVKVLDKKGKTVFYATKSGKTTSCKIKAKKGYKVYVRPIKKVGETKYVGVWSKAKKVKK